MKIKFKHQDFQREATKAVVDVFKGQQKIDIHSTYTIDEGEGKLPFFEGYRNEEIHIDDDVLKSNIIDIQKDQNIEPISSLMKDGCGVPALSIEMETGTGKTYTYIKTMFELHKQYGWSKFIVIVPSVAIREGVISSLRNMQEHFCEEYGERMHYFVYDSSRLTEIKHFAQNSGIHVMVINTQAFNSAGKDAKRIHMNLESYNNNKPIETIAYTKPIIIIDEPQSVLGVDKNNKTREMLKSFNPLFTLLYSATHRREDIYNQVYRLDAIDALNKSLVKKIEVVGMDIEGTTGTNGYVHLERIEISKTPGQAPKARITFDIRQKNEIKRKTKLVDEGFDIYKESGNLESYNNGFVIERIDGANGIIRLNSGEEIAEGQSTGNAAEDSLRRNQIRRTIEEHLKREEALFSKGIKVLSLFFIDSVEKYRIYENGGETRKGKWAEMFEEEYNIIVKREQSSFSESYLKHISQITAEETHQGYFSQDKKGNFINSTTKRGESGSNDQSAYELIMKDKERLLSFDEPVRFIFSHSALKEGWDNPNVFQICTLKNSDNETKKRQELGRGMRLCVNQYGERQDKELLGEEVNEINRLTIIASESYDKFSNELQKELAESITSRPTKVNADLFIGKTLTKTDGSKVVISKEEAESIILEMAISGYVSKEFKVTDEYNKDKERGEIAIREYTQESITNIVSGICDISQLKPKNVTEAKRANFRKDKFENKDFQRLWEIINQKTYYEVSFDDKKFVENVINKLNESLYVPEVYIRIKYGKLNAIESKEQLSRGNAMEDVASTEKVVKDVVNKNVRYDLVGELVKRTGLRRVTIANILKGMKEEKFNLFKRNPEEFIMRVGNIIESQKGASFIKEITYHKQNSRYDSTVFTNQDLKGVLNVNAIESKKSLYDLIVLDSMKVEKDFAEKLEEKEDVVVYTKLPRGFHINTPVGKYNPDWAIVFDKEKHTHLYFIAETKGDVGDMQLRTIEKAKIECAKKHFSSISNGRVKMDAVESYNKLSEILNDHIRQN